RSVITSAFGGRYLASSRNVAIISAETIWEGLAMPRTVLATMLALALPTVVPPGSALARPPERGSGRMVLMDPQCTGTGFGCRLVIDRLSWTSQGRLRLRCAIEHVKYDLPVEWPVASPLYATFANRERGDMGVEVQDTLIFGGDFQEGRKKTTEQVIE